MGQPYQAQRKPAGDNLSLIQWQTIHLGHFARRILCYPFIMSPFITNHLSKWQQRAFICNITSSDFALWRDKRLKCLLLRARYESNIQSLCQLHCTALEYRCHLVAVIDKYISDKPARKTVNDNECCAQILWIQGNNKAQTKTRASTVNSHLIHVFNSFIFRIFCFTHIWVLYRHTDLWWVAQAVSQAEST